MGDVAHGCLQDGTGFVDETCDPLQGTACDPETGQCSGSCAPHALGHSYLGCDYYPTIIGNSVETIFHFAIAISNAANAPTIATIEGGGLPAPITLTIPPYRVAVQDLPWNLELKLCARSDGQCHLPDAAAFSRGGAFRVRTTNPVTVYQFNALEYQVGPSTSITNDASLLIPSNAWGTSYFAAGFAPVEVPNDISPFLFGSEFAVVAQHDSTMVTITTRDDTVGTMSVPPFAAGVPQTMQLDAGDVLELSSVTGDLTGSQVTADQSVQLISGHYLAYVPHDITTGDHLEESMFPVNTLGVSYVVNAPAMALLPEGKVEIVRIIATKPQTTLEFVPPQPGAPSLILEPGDFLEMPSSAASYQVTASAPIMVVQYMEGQAAGGGEGDPSMALAVPVEQYRSSYLFHAPLTYPDNFVDVTMRTGDEVLLDNVEVTGTPIAGTAFSIAHVPLMATSSGDGNHRITGQQAFGISVYGYGQHTSYWYPGGLEFAPLLE